MSAENDGGPAFPWKRPYETSAWGPGMSLRDYFAAAAMAQLANGDAMERFYEQHGELFAIVISKRCYTIADAMLEARKAK